jgi:hypothetical protein
LTKGQLNDLKKRVFEKAKNQFNLDTQIEKLIEERVF